MLELKSISKSFANKPNVCVDISLIFPENGIVSIIGPSGCGKSTLLSIIAGHRKQTSGEILINGKHTTTSERKSKISYLFQDKNLIDNASVFDNLRH